jgi:hypothetical protein
MQTLPSVKSKEMVLQLSPKNSSTIKEKKSEPRRDVQPELSGSGSAVTSSDDFDN